MTMNFFITHNGCEPTLFETEKVRNNLIRQGFKNTDISQSDIIIILGCTFTNQKELESNNLITKYLNLNKNIIVSGCFIKNQYKTLPDKVKYVNTNQLISFLTNILNSEINNLIDIPIIPISTGCTGNCSYCSIKLVKGKHQSFSKNIIFKQLENLSNKYSTIKLVGQDIAAYGIDVGTSFTQLLKDIFSTFPSMKIALGSLNPNHLIDLKYSDLELFNHHQITGNIHIPVQSASNKLLKHMKREYSIEEFENLYRRLNNIGVTMISTDMISGYPIESISDHKKNLEFLSKFYFSFIEIFMFEPRNGTLASKMQDLTLKLKSKRTIELIVKYLHNYSLRNKIDIESLVEENQIYNTNIDFK